MKKRNLIELKSNVINIRKFKNTQQIIINNLFFITVPLHFSFQIIDNKFLLIDSNDKAFKGTLISHIRQIFNGPYNKILALDGIGYKIELINNQIKCSIGYSHPLFFDIPKNIEVKVVNNKEIHASSNSLQKLTLFLNKILQIKPAYKDKYKNKGFKFLN